ncbi:solute carrier family 2, facilitated glucose transporter member 12 isoform X2 [Leucoraja erinacea]|uniref:solute carrier family 2, facilitated glucose transporter member 12 isoform X2 n=1 Tax=Leucoraja erinaceus TaxID=7782 RepID=UPI0024573534|nr:solute carrier family 2, facilitated glucose transporter member 12 isoform X2 [Leucoraja erinacea]
MAVLARRAEWPLLHLLSIVYCLLSIEKALNKSSLFGLIIPVLTALCFVNDLSFFLGSFNFALLSASVIASISGLIFGYELANISGALLQLTIDYQLTCRMQELLVSAILIGGTMGSIAGGYMIDRWERRIGIVLTTSCFVIGNVIMSSSMSYPILILGRIIVGIATTSGVFSACIYLSEIAPFNKRGMLVAMIEFQIVTGVLLAYVVNYAFANISNGWRWMFGINLIPAVLQLIGVFFLPSSPRFMIKKGYDEKASLILMKIRSYSNVADEITTIKSSLSNESNYTFLDIFRTKENIRRRVGIGFGLVIFLQASGQPNVLYYASTILRSVGFASDKTATLASISVGLVKVLGTVTTMFLIDRIGRKAFLYIGSIGMIVMLIFLAMVVHEIPLQLRDVCHTPNYTYHQQNNVTYSMPGYISTTPTVFASKAHVGSSEIRNSSIMEQNNMGNTTTSVKNRDGTEQVSPLLKWLSLAFLLTYIAAYSISFGPVVWVLLSELFPLGIKGRAVAFIGSLNWCLNLVIALTFLSMTDYVGLTWMFLIYAMLSFGGLIFIILFIPETKGRTLENISEQLAKGYDITGACCLTEHIKKLLPERCWEHKDENIYENMEED